MRLSRLFLLLLLLIVLIPAAANSTGTLAIPNTIAAQPAGNLQASLLDTNWTTIASYINLRQITFDILGNRPAAATAGRFYLSTDTDGGTLYGDNGASWTQLAPGVTSAGAGSYSARGLRWATATATNTTYNGTADLVTLRNPSTGALVTRRATTTVTNNVLTSGPAANGRDRSAVFSASTWLHFYYIWNGSSLDSVSTSCAPSDVTGVCPTVGGPVLPTGYTHWAYIGPVRFATTSILNATSIYGARASIVPQPIRANAATLVNTEASIDVSAYLPPNHQGATLQLCSNRVDLEFSIRGLAGGPAVLGMGAGGGAAVGCAAGDAPLTDQTVRFITPASVTAAIMLTGFRIPNGGD